MKYIVLREPSRNIGFDKLRNKTKQLNEKINFKCITARDFVTEGNGIDLFFIFVTFLLELQS